MHRRTILFASMAILLTQQALAQSTPARIRGTVRALEENALTVENRDGDPIRINLAANYTVTAIVPASLDAIRPGVMVGIVGFGPPKQQRAAVISIFPAGSTVNETQFPWDSQPDSVMTNAPVTSEVSSSDGRRLVVTLKGEPVEVAVPPNAVIQTSEPGTPDMLTPGAKVLIFAQRSSDGTLSASRVSVGKNGFTPAN